MCIFAPVRTYVQGRACTTTRECQRSGRAWGPCVLIDLRPCAMLCRRRCFSQAPATMPSRALPVTLLLDARSTPGRPQPSRRSSRSPTPASEPGCRPPGRAPRRARRGHRAPGSARPACCLALVQSPAASQAQSHRQHRPLQTVQGSFAPSLVHLI